MNVFWPKISSSPHGVRDTKLFGFRNPLVQRLLRELIQMSVGKHNRELLSSNFSNGDGGVEPETLSPDSILYPDLSPSLGKPQNMRKRTRKQLVGKA